LLKQLWFMDVKQELRQRYPWSIVLFIPKTSNFKLPLLSIDSLVDHRWACLTHLTIPYSCPIWTPFTTGLHHGAISARTSHGAFITDWILL
jgi:hypothetical protein